MPLRAATTMAACLLAPALLLCQSAPPAPQTLPVNGSAAARPVSPAESATTKATDPRVLFFYVRPRSTVELAVHTVPASNEARLTRLRDDFGDAGCNGARHQEQPVPGKHGDPGTNLICTWPGDPQGGLVVVAAHYDHEGHGEGALDDWSGAALLPFLYQAIQGQPRQNTFIFLESWKAEGARVWLKSLSHDQRKRIRAMIDVDALGLGATRYFTTFRAFETAPPAAGHLQQELLWAAIDDGYQDPPQQTDPHHWLTADNTDPFRAYMVPTLVVHSVPPGSAHLPGSAADVPSAIDGNAYYQSYRLLCTFLASLDHMAGRLAANDPFWLKTPFQDTRPEDETPRVSFRTLYRGRLGAIVPNH